MALSFGRKKGQSAGEADDSSNSVSGATSETSGAVQPNPATGRAKGNATEEPIDESWFETFSEEAAAQNTAVQNSAATNPDFSVPVTTPTPQFSAYNTQNENAPDEFGDFGANVSVPSAQAAQAHSQTDFNNGVFVDPSSGAVSSDSATPFDTSSATTTPTPAKEGKGGGLKKILPVLAVLLILGGGGAFWMSQQGSGEDTEEFSSAIAPPASSPPPRSSPATAPPVTGAPTGAPTGAAPTSLPPTSANPALANSGATGDPKVKAQLKKLWDEGLALRKKNRMAAAKAKWNEAVKLARSKPGHEKSAGMIQQAIDKLK